MDTLNKLEALEVERVVNPCCLPSPSTSEHSNHSMACAGEEAVHPSVPMLCMQTGHGGAVDGGAALQLAGDICCHNKEPHAVRVHDILQLHTFICF